MSLATGQKLAHYEILEPIGKGGMGEVYRAKDAKLERDVAIKVLPDEFARDDERLRRFQREAKVLASLNHPNIASIYGVEHSGETHYLVLELVPGETLADRIARGPIPVDETLEIAGAIAAALEEAHERGIVHRDLKPANVKLTEDGKVKVLDFGLAKAFAEEMAEADSSMSPTITRDATRAGVILGTAAYMSPEQAKGKRVDKRTDIFSLGAVLYEMLAGKKAFPGDDVSDVLASILKLEPDWDQLPVPLSSPLSRVLRRCLEKDARRRWRDAGDVRIELESLPVEDERHRAGTQEGVGVSMRWRARALWFAVGALAVVLTMVFTRSPTTTTPPTVTRFEIPLPEGTSLEYGGGAGVAISPDGSRIVFPVHLPSGRSQLQVRAIDRMESTPLDGTEGARSPFFSPDGEWVAFVADGQLKKVSITVGGAPATICEAPDIYGASWEADDTIFFGQYRPPDGSHVYRVSAYGGPPEPVAEAENPPWRAPFMGDRLPDGATILFGDYYGTIEEGTISMLSLETLEKKTLLGGGHYARYVETGHIIFDSRDAIMAVPFDAVRLELTGSPVPVVDDLKPWQSGDQPRFDVSNDGSLVYVPSGSVAEIPPLFWVDRDGKASPLAMSGASDRFLHPRLSPDGDKLAVSTGGDIWIHDLGRSTMTRLTFGEGFEDRPVWSHDGSRIHFASDREDGVTKIFWKAADGSGDVERFTPVEPKSGHVHPDSIAGNGDLLVFEQLLGADNHDIAVVPFDGSAEPEILVGSRFDETGAAVSPDGRWLAYTSDESGRREVYLRPLGGSGGREPVSTNGGAEPVWSRDGQELFYRNGYQMFAVRVSGELDPVLSRPELLFEEPFRQRFAYAQYDVAADGRFLMIGQPDLTRIHVVLNWLEELRRLVPTDE